MSSVHVETLVALGYAGLLIVAAMLLDKLALHSHRRSDRYRTAGFQFHHHLDVWECPEGQHLPLAELDTLRRVARYRGKAAVCNACHLKEECTDSMEGREIAVALDPWPHSEAGRFHRGIAVVMVGMGALVLLGAGVLNPEPADVAVAGVGLVACALAAFRLVVDFRHTPAGFPGGSNMAAREASVGLTLRGGRG